MVQGAGGAAGSAPGLTVANRPSPNRTTDEERRRDGGAVGRGDSQGGRQLPGVGRDDPGCGGALAGPDQGRRRPRERRRWGCSTPGWPSGSRRPPMQVAAGEHDDQFPIDVFQTGSGTSSNMNANEVIATLAGDGRAPQRPRQHGPVVERRVPVGRAPGRARPHDHELLPAVATAGRLAGGARREEFADVVKAGRTHLMDAVPVTLGQEFGGYAAQVREGQPGSRRRSSGWARSRWAAPPSAPGSTRIPGSPRRCATRLSADTGLADPAAGRPVRGAGQPRRAGRGVGGAEGCSPCR